MSNGNAPTHLTNLKDARSHIGKIERRVAELEKERDYYRDLAQKAAAMNAAPQGGLDHE